MMQLSKFSFCFVFVATTLLTVRCESDALTATLFEEMLSMKDQINALELRIYELENENGCASEDDTTSAPKNGTFFNTVCLDITLFLFCLCVCSTQINTIRSVSIRAIGIYNHI